jgi:hypothetical protein
MSELMFEGAGRAVPLSVIRRPGVRRMNLRVDAQRGAVRLTLPRLGLLSAGSRKSGLGWRRNWTGCPRRNP